MSEIVAKSLSEAFENETGRTPTEEELDNIYSEYCQGIEDFLRGI